MTKETTLSEIYEKPEFRQVREYLIGGGSELFQSDKRYTTLKQLQQKQPTWYSGDILYGLERLEQVAQTHKNYVYHVYTQEERIAAPELKDVILIHMPAKVKKSDCAVILLAGGAYGAVCTMIEALPVAARLNEMGFSCFCLNYRIAGQVDLADGLMPKPLNDLAAAWRLIKNREEEFHINAEQYIVGGFSAGGHIAALWGTEKKGYFSYGIQKPELLLLAYPLISMETIEEPLKKVVTNGLFGKNNTEEIRGEYEVERQIWKNYPQTYLIQSEDDDTVPIVNAQLMEHALEKCGIRYYIERLPAGGHGFGLGSVTPGKGWIERAVQKFYGGDGYENI